MDNFFHHCGECDMPVTIHLAPKVGGFYGIVDDLGLPRLTKMLKKHKKLKIFGHGPVFWNEMAKLDTVAERGVYFGWRNTQVVRLPSGPVDVEGTVPRLFRKYENLMGDLSDFTAYNAFARDPEYGPRFMDEFQDRLFFGTDMCAPDMQVDLPALMISWKETGKISETTFRKIAWENAAKLLEL
jgi:predicted TIM-barrel fold metal-dependent hydrolase